MSQIAGDLSGQVKAVTALACFMFACSGGSGTANRGSGGVGGSIAAGVGGQPGGGLASQPSSGSRQLTGGSATSSNEPSGGRSTGGGVASTPSTGGVPQTGGATSASTQPGGGQSAGGVPHTVGTTSTFTQPSGGTSAGGVPQTGGSSSQGQGGQATTGGNGTGGAQSTGGAVSLPQGGQGAVSGNGSAGALSTAGAGSDCAPAPGTVVGTDSITYLSGVTVATLAGGAVAGTADGVGAEAQFSNPVSIARMPDDSLVVADYNSSLIRRVVPTTGAVTTLTTFFRTGMLQPYGLGLLDGSIVSHTDKNSAHTKTTESGTLWSVDATSGNVTRLGENLGRPRSLVGLSGQRILFADFAHHVVGIFDTSIKALESVAGLRDCAGFADGQGANALFNSPSGVVQRHSDGAFVVADTRNARLRLIDASGTVSTLVGDGIKATVDGPVSFARFARPRALAIDSNDNIYVSDDSAHRIRRIDSSGNVVTIAGAGSTSTDYADGSGEVAKFAGQEGIAVSSDGKTLYVADGTAGSDDPAKQSFHRMRVIALP